jgi:hypothetical protein
VLDKPLPMTDWLLSLHGEQRKPPLRSAGTRPARGRGKETSDRGSEQAFDLAHPLSGSPSGADVELLTYNDAVLHTRTGGVILNGAFMPPCSGRPFVPSQARIDEFVAEAQALSVIREPVTVGYHPGWRNYYHWTTQCLFSIHLLQRAGRLDRGCLALPRLRDMQHRSLELLGVDFASIMFVDPNTAVRVRRVTTTNWLFSATGKQYPRQLHNMALSLKSRITPGPKPGAAAIYISRLDSKRRKMKNEEALIERLEQLGVQHVQMGGKSLDEQISMVSGARVIIGPHGAGLTNVLYGSPGAHVYELLPSSYTIECYKHLARAAGLKYSRDLFDASVSNKSNELWMVNPERVAARTEKLLGAIGS